MYSKLALSVLILFAPIAVRAAPLAKVVSVEFSETPAPSSPEEMTTAYTRSQATVRYTDGRQQVYPLTYHTLFRSGDKIGEGEAGLVVDRHGKPVLATLPDEKGRQAKGPFHSAAPDGNSLMQVVDGMQKKIYLVTHYEYHPEAPLLSGSGTIQLYGQLPMTMSLTALAQDQTTGRLQATNLSTIDMNPIGGLWSPCAASLTPWNTHLGGEEYEPDARQFEHEPLEPMNLYLGTPGVKAADGGANPYRYGHPVEVKVGAGGTATPVKRYAMGRLSAELAEVMPDRRTAYMGDDGRDTMMFMFVADRPRDLSAGTLYAARWEQTSASNAGRARLTWIRLGHATEREIKTLVDHGIRFSDIFESATPAEVKADPVRYADYTPVFVYEGQSGRQRRGEKPEPRYLRVKPGMEKAAAFLESRRYGAMLGATGEFTKMEGVTHNPRERKLYVAMSYIESAMLDGNNGERPQDHIRLQGDSLDLACGAVYQATLAGRQVDSSGRRIPSQWVASTMEALLLGAKKPAGQTHGAFDSCDTDRMANPDNIKYSPEMRILFIGEDSGNHLNNFLWALNIDSGRLTRLMSAPIGGEHTGLQVVPNLNGFGYIMGNIQHPASAHDLKKFPDSIKIDLRRKTDQRGSVGYLGGLPALKR